jgi:Domain of unknown function (DUF3437)
VQSPRLPDTARFGEDAWEEFSLNLLRKVLFLCENAERRRAWGASSDSSVSSSPSELANWTHLALRAAFGAVRGVDFAAVLLPIIEDFLSERLLDVSAGDVFVAALSAICNHAPDRTNAIVGRLVPHLLGRIAPEISPHHVSNDEAATVFKALSVVVRYGGSGLLAHSPPHSVSVAVVGSAKTTLAELVLDSALRFVIDSSEEISSTGGGLTQHKKVALRRAAAAIESTLRALLTVYICDFRAGDSPVCAAWASDACFLNGHASLHLPSQRGVAVARSFCARAFDFVRSGLGVASSDVLLLKANAFRCSLVLRRVLSGAGELFPLPELDSPGRPRSSVQPALNLLPDLGNNADNADNDDRYRVRYEFCALLARTLMRPELQSDPFALYYAVKASHALLTQSRSSAHRPDELALKTLWKSQFSARPFKERPEFANEPFSARRPTWPRIANLASCVGFVQLRSVSSGRNNLSDTADPAFRDLFASLFLCSRTVWEKTARTSQGVLSAILQQFPRSRLFFLESLLSLESGLGFAAVVSGVSQVASGDAAPSELLASVRAVLFLLQTKHVSRCLGVRMARMGSTTAAGGDPLFAAVLGFLAAVTRDSIARDGETAAQFVRAARSILLFAHTPRNWLLPVGQSDGEVDDANTVPSSHANNHHNSSNALIELLLSFPGTAQLQSAQWSLFQITFVCLRIDARADLASQSGTLQKALVFATDMCYHGNATVRVCGFRALEFLCSAVTSLWDHQTPRQSINSGGEVGYLQRTCDGFLSHLNVHFDEIVSWIVSDHRAADVNAATAKASTFFSSGLFHHSGSGSPSSDDLNGLLASRLFADSSSAQQRREAAFASSAQNLTSLSGSVARTWASCADLAFRLSLGDRGGNGEGNGGEEEVGVGVGVVVGLAGRMAKTAESLCRHEFSGANSGDAAHPLDEICAAAEIAAGLLRSATLLVQRRGRRSEHDSVQAAAAVVSDVARIAILYCNLDSVADWAEALRYGVSGAPDAILACILGPLVSAAGEPRIASNQIVQRLLLVSAVFAESVGSPLHGDCARIAAEFVARELSPRRLIGNDFKQGSFVCVCVCRTSSLLFSSSLSVLPPCVCCVADPAKKSKSKRDSAPVRVAFAEFLVGVFSGSVSSAALEGVSLSILTSLAEHIAASVSVPDRTISKAGEKLADVLFHSLVTLFARKDATCTHVVSPRVLEAVVNTVLPLAFHVRPVVASVAGNESGEENKPAGGESSAANSTSAPSDSGDLALALITALASQAFLPSRIQQQAQHAQQAQHGQHAQGQGHAPMVVSPLPVLLAKLSGANSGGSTRKVVQTELTCLQLAAFTHQFEIDPGTAAAVGTSVKRFLAPGSSSSSSFSPSSSSPSLPSGTGEGSVIVINESEGSSHTPVRESEIRATAQAVVEGLVRGGVFGEDSPVLLGVWLAAWRQVAEATLRRKKRGRPLSSATLRRRRYADVLGASAGLCGVLVAKPFSVPPWMPGVLELLSAVRDAFGESDLVHSAITAAFSEWWKTHRDSWPRHAHLFSERQRAIVADSVALSAGVSYFV